MYCQKRIRPSIIIIIIIHRENTFNILFVLFNFATQCSSHTLISMNYITTSDAVSLNSIVLNATARFCRLIIFFSFIFWQKSWQQILLCIKTLTRICTFAKQRYCIIFVFKNISPSNGVTFFSFIFFLFHFYSSFFLYNNNKTIDN